MILFYTVVLFIIVPDSAGWALNKHFKLGMNKHQQIALYS